MFKFTLKRTLLLNAKFILGLVLSALLFYFSAAQALGTFKYKSFRSNLPNEVEIIPSLAVLNLRQYLPEDNSELSPELYLYVLYAKGIPAGLSSRDANLKKIKKVLRFEIRQGSLFVPSQSIEKEPGIVSAYDLIVFVISPFDNFVWLNSNGASVEYPKDYEAQGISVHLATDYVRKDQIDRFLKSQDLSSTSISNVIFTFPFGLRN